MKGFGQCYGIGFANKNPCQYYLYIVLALPKELQNMLVLPTAGNAKYYLVYSVGLHVYTGKAKTH